MDSDFGGFFEALSRSFEDDKTTGDDAMAPEKRFF